MDVPATIAAFPAALPTLQRIEDCANRTLTVKPFIPQLFELPNQVLENIASPAGLRQLYTETNPLISGFAASLALSVIFAIAAEINRNYSQVDRAWSLLPNLYVVHLAVWARLAGIDASRVEFLCSATTLWSVRLTFNYARKGGYNVGSEDYRWEIVQKYVPHWVFFIFSIVFIAIYQNILLFAFSCAPAYVILLTTQFEREVGASDWAYCGIMLALVLSEYISDGQQWDFHAAKHKYQKSAQVSGGFTQADLDRGFLTKGLWAHSRHPNFAAEQLVWFMLYQWSCYASRTLFNWSFVGSGSLILLFQGSTWLTELITTGKYADYKHYQKNVAMFLPTSLSGYKAPPPTANSTSEKRNGKK
ncbi:hypothetical protein BN1708_012141 [Verticillium longisporum]|uniref:Steroid 5-alpha reductase C-terminal domain-containing protein n=2 Tax=Verticillium longisporum TaxID=100787 RepID=A0A0G4L7B7_VERLO|nr:hypothetical protein BN1708_012141 [Verticillium longisporum]